MRCYKQCVQIYSIYTVHVNCEKDYGGQTFSYILDMKNASFGKNIIIVSSCHSVGKFKKSLVYNYILSEDISSAAIKKHYIQEYNSSAI